jgi:hypothetical protein
VLAFGALTGSAFAADLFVDGGSRASACHDSDTGADLTQPLCTLRAALQRARPGDRIILRQGTYRENAVPPIDGTPDAPIVIRSFDGETATISGAEPVVLGPGSIAGELSISLGRAALPLGFIQAADPSTLATTGCPERIRYDALRSAEPGRASVRVSSRAEQCEAEGVAYEWLAIVREIDLSSRRHVVFEGIKFEDVTVRVSSEGSVALDDCTFASASVTSAAASAPEAGAVSSHRSIRRGTPPTVGPSEPCGLNCNEQPPGPAETPLPLAEGGTGASDAENARMNIGAASDDKVLHLDRNEVVTGAKVLAAPGIALDVPQAIRAGSIGIGTDPGSAPGDLAVGNAVNMGANRAIYWPTFAPVATRFFLGTTGAGTLLNGQEDNVLCRAYNTDCSGTKFVATEHTFKDQIEATYDASTGPGIREAVELVWDYSPDNTSSSWRPFGMFLDTTANGGDGTAEFSWQGRRGNVYAFELRGDRVAFNRDMSSAGLFGRLSLFDRIDTNLTATVYGYYQAGTVRHPNDGVWWDYVSSYINTVYDASSPTSTLGGLYGLRTNLTVAGANATRRVNNVVGHEINMILDGSGIAQRWRGLNVEFKPTGADAVVSGPVAYIRIAAPGTVGANTTINSVFGIDIEDLRNVGSSGNAIFVRTQSGGASRGNLVLQGGGWNNGHLTMGASHLWYDLSSQRLRTSAGTPVASTSGNAIVAGTGVDTHGPAAWAAQGTSGTNACTSLGLTCVAAFPARGGSASTCDSTTDYRVVFCK